MSTSSKTAVASEYDMPDKGVDANVERIEQRGLFRSPCAARLRVLPRFRWGRRAPKRLWLRSTICPIDALRQKE